MKKILITIVPQHRKEKKKIKRNDLRLLVPLLFLVVTCDGLGSAFHSDLNIFFVFRFVRYIFGGMAIRFFC
jgi:hypothetical protein